MPHLPAVLPTFTLDEVDELIVEEPVTVFFSRNFLLMFTALNRFGCGAADADREGCTWVEPNGTSEGREGGALAWASAVVSWRALVSTESVPSTIGLSSAGFSAAGSSADAAFSMGISFTSLPISSGCKVISAVSCAIDASQHACQCILGFLWMSWGRSIEILRHIQHEGRVVDSFTWELPPD